MNSTVRSIAPDYPLFPRGWMILVLGVLTWLAFVGVFGGVMALVVMGGGAA